MLEVEAWQIRPGDLLSEGERVVEVLIVHRSDDTTKGFALVTSCLAQVEVDNFDANGCPTYRWTTEPRTTEQFDVLDKVHVVRGMGLDAVHRVRGIEPPPEAP